MNITLGIDQLKSEANIKQLVDLGVTEFFGGLVPEEWSSLYGWEVSPNRRYFKEQQFTDISKFKETISCIHQNNASFFLTLNDHYYINDQLDLLEKIYQLALEANVDGFIVSDFALLLTLNKWGCSKDIHISGDAGSYSAQSIRFYQQHKAKRVIFPRNVTVEEVKSIAHEVKDIDIELEVFIYGEKCLHSSDVCFSIHEGNHPPLCLRSIMANKQPQRRIHLSLQDIVDEISQRSDLSNEQIRQDVVKKLTLSEAEIDQFTNNMVYTMKKKLIKSSGILSITGEDCGLCAIHSFRQYPNIVSYKITGRGIDRTAIVKRIKTVFEKNYTPEECIKNLGNSQLCQDKLNCYYGT